MLLKKYFLIYFFLFLLAPAFLSCSSKPPRAPKALKHKRSAYSESMDAGPFVRVVSRNSPKSLPNKLKQEFSHPFTFTQDELWIILSSLNYSVWDRMGIYEKPVPIFSRNVINNLAPQMVKAFKESNLEKVVYFQVMTKKAKTMGYTLVSENSMYWTFSWINGLPYDYSDQFYEGPDKQDENPHPNWKVTEKKGQKLFRASGFISRYDRGDSILISLKYFKVGALQKPGNHRPKPSTADVVGKKEREKGNVLERYLALRKLRKEKIVNDSEFDQKIRELKKEKNSLAVPDQLKLLKYFRMDGLVTEDEYDREKQRLLEQL